MANEEQDGVALERGKTVIDTTKTVGAALMKTTSASAEYQSIIRDIAQPDGPDDKVDESQVARQLADMSAKNGMDAVVLGKAVRQMMEDGVERKAALETATVLAQFSVGQGTGAEDSARLVSALSQEAQIPAERMEAALGSVAKFGNDNHISRADMAQVLPGILRDLARLGITGLDAVNQANAVLKAQVGGSADPKEIARNFHAQALKLRGNGSEADIAKGAAALRKFVPVGDVEQAAPGYLEQDMQHERGKSEAKWGEAGRAGQGASIAIGDALRPATDFAAEQLTALGNGAASLARAFPEAVRAVTGLLAVGATVAAARTLPKAGKALWNTAKSYLTGKGKEEADKDEGGAAGGGVQRVFVTNWRDGGRGGDGGDRGRRGRRGRGSASAGAAPGGAPPGARRGGAGGPGLPGRAWGSVRNAGAAIGRGALNVGGVVGGALLSAGKTVAPIAGGLLRAVGVAGAVYQAGVLAKALVGGTGREKEHAIGGTAAQVAGAGLGFLVGGPVGAMAGSVAGQVLWAKFGDAVLDTRDQRKAEAQPVPQPPVAPAFAKIPNGFQQLGAQAAGGMPVPGLVPAPAPAALTPLLAAQPAAWQPGFPTFNWPVTQRPANAPLSRTPDNAAELAAAGTLGAASAAPGGAAQARRTGQGAGGAAVPPTQFNFKPNVSITVQGDARDPRRIADELMPYLRQLFDQFQAQQRRGAMHDAPTDAGGSIWI